MASRTLRHTPLSLYILKTLLSVKNSAWTVSEVSDVTGLSYGSCYTLLKRLVDRRVVWRSYVDDGVGSPKLHFEINDYGIKVAQRMLKTMPHPEAFLDACIVEDETTSPRLSVVGAVG
jgi:DNA-binding PadR family transcriptional regulator